MPTASEYTRIHRAIWTDVDGCDCGDDLQVTLPNRAARRLMTTLEIYRATKEVHRDGCRWNPCHREVDSNAR